MYTDSAPACAKLYINMQNPGFNDVEDLEPAQKVPLSAADFDTDAKTPLKVVKFQRVNRLQCSFVAFMTRFSLTIFIDENGGEEYTTLSGLKIYGTALDTVNVAAIHEKRQEHEHQDVFVAR